jgi:hypothetical protein
MSADAAITMTMPRLTRRLRLAMFPSRLCGVILHLRELACWAVVEGRRAKSTTARCEAVRPGSGPCGPGLRPVGTERPRPGMTRPGPGPARPEGLAGCRRRAGVFSGAGLPTGLAVRVPVPAAVTEGLGAVDVRARVLRPAVARNAALSARQGGLAHGVSPVREVGRRGRFGQREPHS